MYHHYVSPKYCLDSKISSIFEHMVLISNGPFIRGFDDRFQNSPVQAQRGRAEDINANSHLHIICELDESGVGIIQSEKNQVFIT